MAMKTKKHLDFEINLVPFIDLLSVCICFLLLTAVWVQVGSMEVKQAVGGQSASETQKQPILSITMNPSGDLKLQMRDAARLPASYQDKLIVASSDSLVELAKYVEVLKSQINLIGLELRSVTLQPYADAQYEQIIEVMDQLRSVGIADLGVVPL